MNSIWILILVLKAGYGIATVTVEFPNAEACQEAMKSSQTMDSYKDSHCFHKLSGKGIKP